MAERQFTPQEIRHFVGCQFYVSAEHERAGLGTPEFWKGWNQAMILIHGYIMGDVDESGIPQPGEITKKARKAAARRERATQQQPAPADTTKDAGR
jgi:hypothetical protein